MNTSKNLIQHYLKSRNSKIRSYDAGSILLSLLQKESLQTWKEIKKSFENRKIELKDLIFVNGILNGNYLNEFYKLGIFQAKRYSVEYKKELYYHYTATNTSKTWFAFYVKHCLDKKSKIAINHHQHWYLANLIREICKRKISLTKVQREFLHLQIKKINPLTSPVAIFMGLKMLYASDKSVLDTYEEKAKLVTNQYRSAICAALRMAPDKEFKAKLGKFYLQSVASSVIQADIIKLVPSLKKLGNLL